MLKRISGLVIGALLFVGNMVASSDDPISTTETRIGTRSSLIELRLRAAQSQTVSRSLSPSFEAWEGAVGDYHPQYFVGREDINFSLIEGLRQEIQTTQSPLVLFSQQKTSLQQHGIGILKRFAPTLDIPADASLVEIYYASIIHAFRLKPQSALEDSIFEHLPGNEGYRSFKTLATVGEVWPFRRSLMELVNHPQNKILRYLMSDEKNRDFFQAEDWEIYYTSSVSGDLYDEVKKLLPFEIYHPTTPGELGLALLPRAFMKDVYPIGLSQEDALVHGTNLTSGSLAWHDDFHGEASEHGRRFIPWVMSTLSRAPQKNLSAQEFLKRAGVHFQKQYGLVMGIYDHLYQQTTGLLIQGREEEYKKMLVAFFLGLHEYPSFSEKMYESHDSVVVLKDHLSRVRSTLKETLSSDALQTDYRTGETSLTDEEIRKALMPQIIAEIQKITGPTVFSVYNGQTGAYEFSQDQAVDYLNKNVHEVKVKRTPYAIDVAVELNNGKKFLVGSTTNNVGLMLNDDYRKLLNFLGHDISQLTLGEDPQINASTVKAYYKMVRGKLLAVLDFFEERAKGMMNPGILVTTKDIPSFAARYFRKSWDNHQAIAEVLLDMGLEQHKVPALRGAFAEKSTVLKEAEKAGLPKKFF